MHGQDSAFCYIQETHLSNKDRTISEYRAGKRLFKLTHTRKKLKSPAIPISYKINFQPKVIKRWGWILHTHKDKLHHDEVSILNSYASNARKSTLLKESELKPKTHIEPQTIMMVDFTIPLSLMNRLIETESKQRHNESNML